MWTHPPQSIAWPSPFSPHSLRAALMLRLLIGLVWDMGLTVFGGMAEVGKGRGAQNCEKNHWTTFARALTKPVLCYWAVVLDLEAFALS